MHSFTYRKITREAPLIAIISGSLMIIALVANILGIPVYNRILRQQKEFSYYESRISSESDYGDLKQDILQKIGHLQTYKQQSDHNIPATDISSYLEYLITLGRENNISFTRMQPQAERSEGEYTIHPLLLVLTTGYHNLGTFVSSLEQLPHLYRIERLALDAGEPDQCTVKILLHCRIPVEAPNAE